LDAASVDPPEHRLARQLDFLLEIDALKQIERMTKIIGGARRENTAEHSWHLALLAIVLVEHAAEPVDLARVVPMLLVHDVVEIDAGDTFAYDEAGHESKAQREQAAADRLYGLLPGEQGAWLRGLWDEFERGDTPEARYALAIDRLQPVLLNHANRGGPWRDHGIERSRVEARNAVIGAGAPTLWAEAQRRIAELDELGLFPGAPA
jgi:putative hydrolases of HD superfamily